MDSTSAVYLSKDNKKYDEKGIWFVGRKGKGCEEGKGGEEGKGWGGERGGRRGKR